MVSLTSETRGPPPGPLSVVSLFSDQPKRFCILNFQVTAEPFSVSSRPFFSHQTCDRCFALCTERRKSSLSCCKVSQAESPTPTASIISNLLAPSLAAANSLCFQSSGSLSIVVRGLPTLLICDHHQSRIKLFYFRLNFVRPVVDLLFVLV